MRKRYVGIALLGALLLVGSPIVARADLVTWNFFNLAADGTILPSPQNVTSSGETINLTAIANTTTNTTGVFFERNEGPGSDEQGLGVCLNATTSCSVVPGIEVTIPEAIKVVLPSNVNNATILFNSLSGGELGAVYAGNTFATATLIGTVAHSNVVAEPIAIPNQFDNVPLWVTAGPGGLADNDVILYGATANTVPEPGTLLLLGSGMVGLAGRLWRRKR